jgi:hypothetical protein
MTGLPAPSMVAIIMDASAAPRVMITIAARQIHAMHQAIASIRL